MSLVAPPLRPPDPPGFAPRLARWPAARVITVSAVGAALITLWFFAPRFWLWRAVGVPFADLVSVQPEFNRAFSALQQVENPWRHIDDATNRVLEWRLLFPVIVHYLHLPRALYFSLPHLGCLLALGASAAFIWRATRDAIATAGGTLLVATTSWFFVSTGWLAYFDSWLILALVLASFAERRSVMFAAALAAPWIDERFILSLPLCLVARIVARAESGDNRREWIRDAASLCAGVAPYLAVRLGAEMFQLRETSKGYLANQPLPPASLGVMLWAAWNGLRLGWIAIGYLVAQLPPARRTALLLIAGATLGVNVCIADDLSRSVSVAVPLILAGVVMVWRTQREKARRTLLFLAIGNLFLPAEHVIASARNVEEAYHRLPILNLYAERARARQLPYDASPLTYNRRGMEAFAAGNHAAAIRAYEIALRFAPDYPHARANLGVARLVSGDRAGGMADLDRALANAPWMYDSRIQRAGFRAQAGDLTGALADVQQALRDAPAGWSKRPDADQLGQMLAAELARR